MTIFNLSKIKIDYNWRRERFPKLAKDGIDGSNSFNCR